MGLQKAVECRPPQAVLGSSSKGSAAGALAQDRFCPPPPTSCRFSAIELCSCTPRHSTIGRRGAGGGEGGEKLHRAGVESCQVSLGTNNGTFCKKINTRCSGVFPTNSIKEQCHKILTTIFS